MDPDSGAVRTQQLDVALAAAFELAPCGTSESALTAAAVACDVDLDALWAHLDAGIELWPRAAAILDAPAHLVRRWQTLNDPQVVAHTLLNPGLDTREISDILEKWAGHANKLPTRTALSHDNLDPSWLERLSHSDDEGLVQQVASHAATPVETLERLALSTSPEVCSRVALNSNTPVPVLERLAWHESMFVVTSVLRNQRTPLELVERFAGHDDSPYAMSRTYAAYARTVLEERQASV